jgi:SAM-dependent methyltransferase
VLKIVDFINADAMALPFPDDAFNLAVMPLVIFFVPELAQGVAEMVRVVAPGGTVAAYAWDLEGGGFPYQSVYETLGAVGRAVPMPPSAGASRLDGLRHLWTTAGLCDIHTCPASTPLAGALHPYVSYRLRFVASRDEIGCRGVEPPLASGRRGP